ncbi:hypothetical protein GA0111570_10153 [Raineyella antarctica]|uniref:4-amino-4-deoxy-L-arabinose transferase n=2 Tax=Raineyella antarctica TaxID=1577474 RepID=A0A1G6GCU1_9ACTN|nr:hypothetical protein GA0111570_10153 [Raineyella antarctica]
MLAPDWSWLTAIPIVIAAVALLWIPGAVLAGGLGAGWWPAIALAPLLTTSLVAVGGILTDLAGMRWGIGAGAFWLLAIPAVVWGLRVLWVRRRRRPWRFDAPHVRWWEVAVGAVVAVLIVCWVFYFGTVRPGNFPQQPDQIFHLGLVRFMVDSGNLSSLEANAFNEPASASFYPAALHGISATLVMLTGAPVVVVENSVLLVSCALIYPLGLMLMLNTLVATDRRLVLLTGLLAAATTAFPWRILSWGAVWAQVFGSVFIPAIIAVYGWGLLQVFRRQHWGSAALLFLISLPGISLAHTSATMVAAAAAILFSLAVAIRHALTARRGIVGWLPAIGFALAGILGPVLGAFAAPTRLLAMQELNEPFTKVVIGMLTFWSGRNDAEQVATLALFALAVLGSVACLRRGRDWWLVAFGWIYIVLCTVLSSRGSAYVWPFTWPWYNWPYRFQATTALAATPLIVVGASWLISFGERLRGRGRGLAIAWTVLVAVGLFTTVAFETRASVGVVRRSYTAKAPYSGTNDAEVRALEQISATLPDDAVVASNPWTGSAFLYVLGPEQTFIHTKNTWSPDIALVAHGLDNVRVDPAVCGAVKRNHITYVITGGREATKDFTGIDSVSAADGFVLVQRTGPYTLWKVPDCRQ